MFVGHYGAAFAAKAIAPKLPLGLCFLGAQALDLLFCTLVLLGVERLRIVPGFTASNPYALDFMPYSHSLLATGLWSALTFGLVAPRWGKRMGLAAGLLVASHWALDWPMHLHDLPLAWPGTPYLGLGIWQMPWVATTLELTLLSLGLWLWWRFDHPRGGDFRRGLWLAAALGAVGLATPFLPDPAGPRFFAIQALVAYLGFAWFAQHTERHRSWPLVAEGLALAVEEAIATSLSPSEPPPEDPEADDGEAPRATD